MKKRVKKILSLLMATAMLVGALGGCASGPSADSGNDSGAAQESGGDGGDGAKGRFIESDIALPQEGLMVMALKQMADGSLKMAAMGREEPPSVWKSSDKGATWEKEGELPDELKENYVSSMAFSENGDYAAVVYEGEKSVLYSVSQDGTVTKLDVPLEPLDMGAPAQDMAGESVEPETEGESNAAEPESSESETQPAADTEAEAGVMAAEGESAAPQEGDEPSVVEANYDNYIYELAMSDDGKLLGRDFTDSIYQINRQDGSIEQTYKVDNGIESFEITGNTLYIIGRGQPLEMYDLETGEPLPADQVLSDELTVKQGDSMAYVSGAKSVLFEKGDQENSVYYCNSTGMYRHLLDGSVSEQMIDGNLATFGNPKVGMVGMEILSEEEIIMVINGLDDMGASQLLRYTYSADAPARPSKEVKVYSLTDNNGLRQAISLFQKANPDYYVSLEIGMTGEDGITAADALRTLNTNIMAGSGPDVLMLDGLPVDSYIERGLLEDISAVIEKIKGQDGLFENIIDAYAQEGAYYAVPSKIKLPVLQGSDDVVKEAGNLEELAKKMETQIQEIIKEKGKYEPGDAQILAEKIYQSYSPALQADDGTLDKDKLIYYFTQLQRLYQKDPDAEETQGGMNSAWAMDETSIDFSGISLLSGEEKTIIGSMGSLQGLMVLLAVADRTEDGKIEQMAPAGSKVFIPESMVGINSQTSKKEDAIAFVEFLLGKEAQSSSQDEGFPVNKAAYEDLKVDKTDGATMGGIMVTGEDGFNLSLEMKWPSEEDFKKLDEMIGSLETPMLTDDVIKEVVIGQALECMTGNATPEQAADSVLQKVNLYLSE